MKPLFSILFSAATLAVNAQTASTRIVHNDPAKYRQLTAVHAGAGGMAFTEMIGRNALATNFLYLHSGVINAKGGIGHHFHHTIEEMYVLLSGEAEFTVNGRTAKLKAPVVVPCKMGESHAIYNPTAAPLKWLNFAVSRVKTQGDAFDLGDSRVGATLDKVPVFVSGELKKDKLAADKHAWAGNGALHRRVFGSSVFSTNWSHVDHLIIPAGKSAGPRLLEGVEEVYYVINGSGNLAVGSSSSAVKMDDAFTATIGESVTLTNSGPDDLELLIIGISATDKFKSTTATTAILLQMDFVVPKENTEAFEKMYSSIYVPAMTVQKGYLGSKLMRLFPEDVAKTIQAEATNYNYSIQIYFDTEENRRKWVASDQHKIAWPAAAALVKEFKWRGYDVPGADGR